MISSVDSNHHHVRALLSVQLADKATFSQNDVRDVAIIRRDTLCIPPAIVLALERNVVVERPSTVANIGCDVGNIFHGGSMRFNSFGVINCQSLSRSLRSIFAGARASGKMKSVDVVSALFLDHGDNILSQPRE